MSRARDQAWLFHSMRAHDFAPTCLRRRVIEFFHQPLDQLIGGVSVDLPKLRLIAARADRTIERPPVPFDSWFELDVALALAARGYQLSAQVQVAKRRIDLVIESDGGRLAVECDGEVWHGPERYADDLFRQRQLERAGWRFARVREGLFYSDEARALADVFGACEELEIGPGFQTFEPKKEATLRSATSGAIDIDMNAASARESLGNSDVSAEPFALGIETSLTTPVQATLDLPPATTASGLPYVGYDAKEYPDPRLAPPANVRDAVLDILERDGPLSKASIYRLYRDGCPKVERAGKHLRQTVNRAIGILERSGKVESRDEGGQKAPEDIIVRLVGEPWVRVRSAGGRTLEEVPPSELAARIRSLARDGTLSVSSNRVAIFREVLSEYGVLQLRQVALERMELALRFLLSQDVA
jgi:very-short-patch-repair endonuclease